MTSDARTIIVAEDEPLASMALRAQLEALGFAVTGPARDGEEAVALGRCYPADLAIFDFRMPRLSGLDAAHQLFDKAPTPVILLSGFDARNLPDQIPRPPIFASVTKPADMKDLRRALDTAVAGFDQWLDAEPRRQAIVRQSRDQRAAIAAVLSELAGGTSLARSAVQLLEQADREGREILEVAQEIAAGRSTDG